MKSEKPYPKGPYRLGMIGEVPRILDVKGNDIMMDPRGPQRLIECANALSEIWYSAAVSTALLRAMSDEERLEVFAHFCTHCGGTNTPCYCMRDD